ncbi:UNVERIFIED_CONTAM: cytochrome [Sesamum angustifolium]|uniref:Cytochrome n=1 Tax=Sesamum angustifolium TaxID=2727405 RepID=A0AAW2IYM0_9LAMI
MTTPTPIHHFSSDSTDSLPPHHHLFRSTIMNSSSLIYGSGSFARYGGFLSFFSEIQMLELLLAVVVFVVIHCLRQKSRQGLPNWPVLGMLPSLMLALRGDMYEWISEVLNRQNGTFTFKGPWFTNLNCVVTSDPRNLEYLLKTKFSNFRKERISGTRCGTFLATASSAPTMKSGRGRGKQRVWNSTPRNLGR